MAEPMVDGRSCLRAVCARELMMDDGTLDGMGCGATCCSGAASTTPGTAPQARGCIRRSAPGQTKSRRSNKCRDMITVHSVSVSHLAETAATLFLQEANCQTTWNGTMCVGAAMDVSGGLKDGEKTGRNTLQHAGQGLGRGPAALKQA